MRRLQYRRAPRADVVFEKGNASAASTSRLGVVRGGTRASRCGSSVIRRRRRDGPNRDHRHSRRLRPTRNATRTARHKQQRPRPIINDPQHRSPHLLEAGPAGRSPRPQRRPSFRTYPQCADAVYRRCPRRSRANGLCRGQTRRPCATPDSRCSLCSSKSDVFVGEASFRYPAARVLTRRAAGRIGACADPRPPPALPYEREVVAR